MLRVLERCWPTFWLHHFSIGSSIAQLESLHFCVVSYPPHLQVFSSDALVHTSDGFHLFFNTSTNIHHMCFSPQRSDHSCSLSLRQQSRHSGPFFSQQQWMTNRTYDVVALESSSSEELLQVQIHYYSSFEPEAFLSHRISLSSDVMHLKDYHVVVVKVAPCNHRMIPRPPYVCDVILRVFRWTLYSRSLLSVLLSIFYQGSICLTRNKLATTLTL